MKQFWSSRKRYTKALGMTKGMTKRMTKAYEKDKSFLETQKERRLLFHQVLPPTATAVNDTNEHF